MTTLMDILFRNAPLKTDTFNYNNYKTSAIYRLDGAGPNNSSHSPVADGVTTQSITNNFFIVLAYGENRVTQILLPGNNPHAFIRSLATDSNSWYKWVALF